MVRGLLDCSNLYFRLIQEKWTLEFIDHKGYTAPLAATATWGLGWWELMNDTLDSMRLVSNP
jgi:phosphatidylinositol kinase/protein kinase (PI-3  family)